MLEKRTSEQRLKTDFSINNKHRDKENTVFAFSEDEEREMIRP